MANVLGELFSDIAQAIRGKTGDTATMKPAEFPAKIMSISQGVDTVEIDSLLDAINGEVVGEIVLASGTCGPSAKYNLKDSGLLYITGSGEITSTPWRNVENHEAIIKKVVISDGITNVPPSAFQSCSNLTSVTLSNTLVKIGMGAFYDCAFQRIRIPASVEEIYEYAFRSCSNLTSVEFMDTAGWKVYTSLRELIAEPTSAELMIFSKAAQYLTDNDNYYCEYRWLKNMGA